MTAPQVGQLVQYLGHENTPMAAVVIMTAGTYQEGMDSSGQFKPADDTSVSLKITRPVSGRSYVRHNVPLEGTLAHSELAQAAEDFAKVAEMGAQYSDKDEAGADADYFGEAPAPKPVVRGWKPVS